MAEKMNYPGKMTKKEQVVILTKGTATGKSSDINYPDFIKTESDEYLEKERKQVDWRIHTQKKKLKWIKDEQNMRHHGVRIGDVIEYEGVRGEVNILGYYVDFRPYLKGKEILSKNTRVCYEAKKIKVIRRVE